MCIIAVLGGLAAVLMIYDFPLAFVAPPEIYTIDLSEVIVLLGAFSLGPIEGIIIELLKIGVKLLVKPSRTACVGEFANFAVGCAFILPASVIYRFNRTRKGAFFGLAAGTVIMAAAGGLLNYFVLIPFFASFYKAPIEAIIGMGSKIQPVITDLKTFVLFATTPFNLIKGVLSSAITLLVYKRLRFVLHK